MIIGIMLQRVRNLPPGCMLVVTDVRFPNEAEAIQREGGIVIRVLRPGMGGDAHASETSVDLINPNFVIINDGTFDTLRSRVCDVLHIAKLLPGSES